MAALVTCKYEESDQRWSHYRSDNIFTIISIWELIFSIQGQVKTPKSVFWSGRNLNSSKNLWLFWLPASLMMMKIRSKLKALSVGQCQRWAFSSLKGKYLLSEKSDLAEVEIIGEFMAVLVICQFDEDLIKIECTIDRTRSNMGFFSTQGQVPLMWIVRCGWKSNLSEILWQNWLPARLKKIDSKVKSLSSGQHYNSMGKFFIVQGQVTPKKIIRSGSMSNLTRFYSCPRNLQDWRTSDQKWSCYWLDKVNYGLFRLSRASNSEVNSLFPPKFELILEFIAASVTCKFDEDPIKIEGTIDRTRSNVGFFCHSGASNSKWIVQSGRNKNSSKISWRSWLPARLMKVQLKEVAIIQTTFSPLQVYGNIFLRSRVSR